MSWKPDLLLKIILILCAVDMTMLWLPLVRGIMDGSTYEWSYMSFISGNGIKGDYWILVLLAAFGFVVQYLGWRGARQPFHWLLLLWNLPAIFVAIGILMNLGNYTFQGDTLGITIPLGIPVALLYGGSFLLAVYWIIRDLTKNKKITKPLWTIRNRYLLAIVISIIPVQFFLLRSGEAHGTTDQVGVILTIVQWFILVMALYPWTPIKRITLLGNKVGNLFPIQIFLF